MKILVNKTFKAIRTGLFAVADSTAGEFLLDTESPDSKITNASLHEVAKANKIEVKKGASRDDLLTAIEAGVEKLDLPTVDEKPDTVKVEEIVAAGVKAGKEDEDMVIEIIEAGIKFKHAAKMFQQAKEKLGFNLSNKDRKDKCYKILKEAKFKPADFAAVSAMAERIIGEVADTELAQAMSMIKKYAKEMEIELPKPEKGKGAVSGFRGKVQSYVLKNPNTDLKAFSAFVKGEGKDQKVADRMWKTIEFAQKIAKAIVALAAKAEK